MASMTNNEKILQAVLLDDKLMEFGGYTAEDIGNIYQAIDSDNCVISAVAQIISRTNEGATESTQGDEEVCSLIGGTTI